MFRFIFKIIRFLCSLAVLFYIGTNLWIWTTSWERLLNKAEDIPSGSVLVLLGTDEFYLNSNIPSEEFASRIKAATELIKSGRIKFVISTGTASHTQRMAQLLRKGGATCPIIEDPYGFRTFDSVARAAAYYPKERFVFVSQTWHNARALWLADYEGIQAVGYSAEFGKGWHPIQSCLRDTLAKPKAVIDRYILSNPLTGTVPANSGYQKHLGL